MKMSKNKRQRQQQQQGGRPVLVTLYVAQAQPRDRGGSTASSSHHHHKRQHHDHQHHSHGGGRPDLQRRRRNEGKSQSNNRRADLLEYSRQLRASAWQQTAASRATESSTPPAPAPPPPRRDTNTNTAVGVRRDERQQVAAVNRLERAMSQQEIRQRCFGGGGGSDGWSWKRVFLLVFPFHGNKSRRPRSRSSRDDSEKKPNINQTGRPAAAWLIGKLAVSKDRRDRSGLLETLTSLFQKRSR